MTRKAKKLKKNLSNTKPYLALAARHAIGLSATEIEQPFIGVVAGWSELLPSYKGLAQQAQKAKRGIRDNNSTLHEFTATALSDEMLLSGNIAKFNWLTEK